MQRSDKPALIPLPFANTGSKRTVPTLASSTVATNQPSLELGFPAVTMIPKTAGGIPPAGPDFNGVFNLLSAANRWSQAGSLYPFDSSFSTTVGGYPKGAMLLSTDGITVWQSSVENNTSDPDGATPTGWLPMVGTSAVARINFLDFVPSASVRASILNGTCTTDLQAYFAAWRAALVADGGERAGYLPAGVYPYSVAQNWAIDRLTVISDGARLRFTGTGPAFICDGVAGTAVTNVAQYNYAVRWLGRTYIEGSAGSGAGMFIKSCHHAVFENFNVRSCGTGYPALNVKFAVCTSFPNLTVSGNEGGWFGGNRPNIGILLEAFAIGADPGQTSYCSFQNPIVEGVPTGVYLSGTLGNTFIGGAIEGCTAYGVQTTSGAQQDKFVGVDFEVNTAADFLVAGWGMAIVDCDTLTKITMQSGAYENTIRGGRHVTIEMLAGAHHNRVRDCTYDRLTGSGVVSDAGTYNSFSGIKKPSSPFIGRPLTQSTITVTASPITISNQTGDPQYYTVTGGTVSSVFRGRFGSGYTIGHYSGCEYRLESGEDLAITYSSAPTITAWK